MFTKNEERLLASFKLPPDFFDRVTCWEVYRIIAVYAFMHNAQGENVEALRRGLKAFNYNFPAHGTEEFDKLIAFEE